MAYKIFVDGQEGTTGLQIHEYLSERTDLDILTIDPEKRKDPAARKELLNAADVSFLCLPDAAAKESVSLVENPKTKVIDASVAFRTAPGWTYGLPELEPDQRQKIREAQWISNPGCHATAFVLALHPLVKAGIVPSDYPVSCTSVTGYSGGGKKLIEYFENPEANRERMRVPNPYALKLNHKHLPEMQKWVGLDSPPIFSPTVCDYYKGLVVTIPLVPRLLGKKMSAVEIREFLAGYYEGEPFVRVIPYESDAYLEPNGFMEIAACNGTNRADIFVFGNADQIMLVSRLDNLGKGASGAAIQNMNIALGLEETQGLV